MSNAPATANATRRRRNRITARILQPNFQLRTSNSSRTERVNATVAVEVEVAGPDMGGQRQPEDARRAVGHCLEPADRRLDADGLIADEGQIEAPQIARRHEVPRVVRHP